MRKWLWIVFIPVGILAVIVWREGKACQAASDQCASTDTANPQQDSPSLVLREDGSLKQQDTAEKTNESCYRSHRYLCRILSPANIPNVFLVLIGLGGIIMAIGTLDILVRQTKATEDAAQAAKDNIALLISKERARLYIESSLELVDMEIRRGPFPRKPDAIIYKVGCYGGTTASILESYINVYLVPQMPHELTTLNTPFDLPKVISPFTNQAIEVIHPIDPEIEVVMTDESGGQDKCVKSSLHFEVFIRYADVFQTETQWELKYKRVWSLSYWYKLPETRQFFSTTDVKETTEEKETKRENPN
jgi:hypothetical protein